jgi:hypothetical protein
MVMVMMMLVLMVMLMFMLVLMVMLMFVLMVMLMFVFMFMVMVMVVFMVVVMLMFVFVILRQVHVEISGLDAALVDGFMDQGVFAQFQFGELLLQVCERNARVHQGAEEHVAADAGKGFNEQCFHVKTSQYLPAADAVSAGG